MTVYMARDGYYIAYAIGTDLTAWLNAKAALVVGELNAIDWFYSANVTHTKPKTITSNPMTAGHYPKRIQTGRELGNISTTHFLQTGILTYAVMGACTTAGGGDPYTHTITKGTTETPINIAFHLEKEGTTDSRRKDVLGVVPRSLDIRMSERAPIAYQTYMANFAYSGAGSDLAQPTAHTQASLPPYTWFNYKNGSGASEFTYNTGAIDVDIVSVNMHIGWTDTLFGAHDGTGYPSSGNIVPPFASYVTLGVRITDGAGTALDAISDLRAIASGEGAAEYAGDIDFICDFYRSANDYIKYTWSDMYIDPSSYQERFQAEGDWFDGIEFTLRFKDESSTLAVEEKNNLDKTYYEND
jgi:hypothetical protein